MKKYLRILSLVVFSLVVISYVQATAKSKSKVKSKDVAKVVFTDPSKPIVVRRAKSVFNLILQANPTTGYSWSLKNYDSSLITPIRHRYYPPKSKKLLGAPGYEKWTFRVRPKGFTVSQITGITLVYIRPWDGQSAKVVNFKVVTK